MGISDTNKTQLSPPSPLPFPPAEEHITRKLPKLFSGKTRVSEQVLGSVGACCVSRGCWREVGARRGSGAAAVDVSQCAFGKAGWESMEKGERETLPEQIERGLIVRARADSGRIRSRVTEGESGQVGGSQRPEAGIEAI